MTGVFSKEYIPQGTRFGPLQGDIYTKDNVPKQANRKYFWRVRKPSELIHLHTFRQQNTPQPRYHGMKIGKISNLDVRK